MEFEWDESKATANLKKHDVSFFKADTVFENVLAVIFDDEAHSVDERREVIIGDSRNNQLLLISFTEHSKAIHIISACLAARREREDYEQNTFEESYNSDDEPLAEYHFDYEKAKPNRFAARGGKQVLKVVVLDEDVAQIFTTPESVNKVLRALIEAMPQAKIATQPNNSGAAD
jgi:uncharacterized protein